MIIYPLDQWRFYSPEGFVRDFNSVYSMMVWQTAFGHRNLSTYRVSTPGFDEDLERWFRGHVASLWQARNPDFKARLKFSKYGSRLPSELTLSRPDFETSAVKVSWTLECRNGKMIMTYVNISSEPEPISLLSPDWLPKLLGAIQDASLNYFDAEQAAVLGEVS